MTPSTHEPQPEQPTFDPFAEQAARSAPLFVEMRPEPEPTTTRISVREIEAELAEERRTGTVRVAQRHHLDEHGKLRREIRES